MAATELFKRKAFAVLAALVVAIMGIVSINSGQILRGSAQTLQNYWTVLTRGALVTSQTSIVNGVQNVTINVTSRGYKSDINTLKLGTPVKLTLIANNVTTCAKAFSIPDYNIFKVLPQNGTETIEFTPTKTGLLTYTCSMGMYTGTFNVVE
jgi:plastocyanin domain-containing protein